MMRSSTTPTSCCASKRQRPAAYVATAVTVTPAGAPCRLWTLDQQFGLGQVQCGIVGEQRRRRSLRGSVVYARLFDERAELRTIAVEVTLRCPQALAVAANDRLSFDLMPQDASLLSQVVDGHSRDAAVGPGRQDHVLVNLPKRLDSQYDGID